MKSFRLSTAAQRKEDCLSLLRGFIADIGNVSNGIEFVGRKKEIAVLLETEMDILNPEERHKVYGFMEGMFPKQFKKILAARLKSETDAKCLDLLRAIADIHGNQAE